MRNTVCFIICILLPLSAFTTSITIVNDTNKGNITINNSSSSFIIKNDQSKNINCLNDNILINNSKFATCQKLTNKNIYMLTTNKIDNLKNVIVSVKADILDSKELLNKDIKNTTKSLYFENTKDAVIYIEGVKD